MYLHLTLEIYTDGVHNVISVSDAMPKLNTTSSLRYLATKAHLEKDKMKPKNKKKKKKQKNKHPTSPTSPSSPSSTSSPSSDSWYTSRDQANWEGHGDIGIFGDRVSYQFGSISLVLIDEEPKELLALTLDEIR